MRPTSARHHACALVALVAVVAFGCRKPADPDPLIADFRLSERTCLLRFNALLRQQKANVIDESALGRAIADQVLPPWRELRARVDAAPRSARTREVYGAIGRYIVERQIAWEAYVAALSARDDVEARPHYDAYHAHDAAADAAAREVGALLRPLALPPLPAVDDRRGSAM